MKDGGNGLELRVDGGLPGLAVELRRRDQMDEVAPKVNVPTTITIDKMVRTSALRTGTEPAPHRDRALHGCRETPSPAPRSPRARPSPGSCGAAARLSLVVWVSWLRRHDGHDDACD